MFNYFVTITIFEGGKNMVTNKEIMDKLKEIKLEVKQSTHITLSAFGFTIGAVALTFYKQDKDPIDLIVAVGAFIAMYIIFVTRPKKQTK